MNLSLLIIGQWINTSAKLTASIALFYAYIQHRRKFTVFWSLAFLVDAFSILFDFVSKQYVLVLFQAFTVSLLFYGAFIILEEEGIQLFPLSYKYISGLSPIVLTLYIIAYYIFRGNTADTFSEIVLMYGIAGFFYFFTGVLLLSLSEIYSRKGTCLAIIFMLYGLHKMDYPFLRPVEWFAPIGFLLGAIFTVLEVVLILLIISSEEFKKLNKAGKEVEIESGILVIDPKEYQKVKEKLKEVPVLAFLRNIKNVPENWEVYFITKIPEPKSISPTELEKIVEISHRYLIEAERKGIKGIILLDCLEYLCTYNEFTSLAKFLTALKDYVIIHEGTLILITEEAAWGEKEWNMLKRLLEFKKQMI